MGSRSDEGPTVNLLEYLRSKTQVDADSLSISCKIFASWICYAPGGWRIVKIRRHWHTYEDYKLWQKWVHLWIVLPIRYTYCKNPICGKSVYLLDAIATYIDRLVLRAPQARACGPAREVHRFESWTPLRIFQCDSGGVSGRNSRQSPPPLSDPLSECVLPTYAS